MVVDEDIEATRTRIEELHSVHRSLDKAIANLSVSHAQDDLELRRLKKQKLKLKDQIATLEKRLVPDIPA